MRSLPILVLAGLVSLATPGFCQTSGDGKTGGDGGVEKNHKKGRKSVVYEKRGSGMAEITYHIGGRVEERILDAAEVTRLRKLGTIGTARTNDLRVMVVFRPRRLRPGQSGELQVLVTLGGKAVALPGKQADLTVEATGAPVRLGTPELGPAAIGRVAGLWKGKPVYEDTMIFRVPVHVAADAPAPQNVPVKGTLVLALYDGDTGRVQGTFYNDIAGVVEIGKPAVSNSAKPNTAKTKSGAVGQDPAKRVAPGAGTAEPRSRENGGRSPTGSTGSGALADPPREDGLGDGPGDGVHPAQVSSGATSLAWVLGGVVLLLVVLILVLVSRAR